MEKRPKACADGKLRSDPQGQIPCNGLDTGPVDEFPLDLIATLMGTDLAVPPVATQIDGPIRTFAHGKLSFPDIGRMKTWAQNGRKNQTWGEPLSGHKSLGHSFRFCKSVLAS